MIALTIIVILMTARSVNGSPFSQKDWDAIINLKTKQHHSCHFVGVRAPAKEELRPSFKYPKPYLCLLGSIHLLMSHSFLYAAAINPTHVSLHGSSPQRNIAGKMFLNKVSYTPTYLMV